MAESEVGRREAVTRFVLAPTLGHSEAPKTLDEAIDRALAEGLRNPAPIARWILKRYGRSLGVDVETR